MSKTLNHPGLGELRFEHDSYWTGRLLLAPHRETTKVLLPGSKSGPFEFAAEWIEGLEARFDFVVDICDMRFGRPANMRHGSVGTQDFGSFPSVAHPLVWKHPESGRRALMVGPTHLVEMVGMVREEGDALVAVYEGVVLREAERVGGG